MVKISTPRENGYMIVIEGNEELVKFNAIYIPDKYLVAFANFVIEEISKLKGRI
jgi:hypothetical protein